MALIAWNDGLSVGIPSIDVQHKKLLAILNGLYDATQKGQGEEVVTQTLHGLSDYVAEHFDYEEKLFAQTLYPQAAAHVKEHTDLKAQLDLILDKHKENGNQAISKETLQFLLKWLLDHTMGSDKNYSEHLIKAGIQ